MKEKINLLINSVVDKEGEERSVKLKKVIIFAAIAIIAIIGLTFILIKPKTSPLANKKYDESEWPGTGEMYESFVDDIELNTALYITSHHEDIEKGKKISSFDDFEKELDTSYKWVYLVENYKPDNDEKDSLMLNHLKKAAALSKDYLENLYNAKGEKQVLKAHSDYVDSYKVISEQFSSQLEEETEKIREERRESGRLK